MANLTMYRGDDKTWNVFFKDDDDVAIDITGYTVFFTVKKQFGYTDASTDDDAIIEKDITSHIDPTGGETQLTISAIQTNSVEPEEYIYDLQLKDDGGNILTVVSGSFILKADVTRRTT